MNKGESCKFSFTLEKHSNGFAIYFCRKKDRTISEKQCKEHIEIERIEEDNGKVL